MILFYNKKTGNIIGVVNGRVHPKEHLQIGVYPSHVAREDVEKIIIGWVEDDEKIYNEHLHDHMHKFEENESPYDYLVKKDKDGNFSLTKLE